MFMAAKPEGIYVFIYVNQTSDKNYNMLINNEHVH